jgi:hypothetical protein
MRFKYRQGNKITGQLTYVDSDRAIDFVADSEEYLPADHVISAALVVDKTLQIEFQVEDGRLLYAWGYSPEESWKRETGSLDIGKVIAGKVFVSEVADEVIPGSGYDTNLTQATAHYFNQSGHVVIGEVGQTEVFIEIAEDTIVGLCDGQVRCLILRPTTIKN